MHPFSTLLVAACLVATASGACDAIPASYVNDTFWENLNGSSYCSGVVTWPLVAGSDFNALDDAAFAAYKLDLEAWTEYQKTFKADANGRKTDNNCLAFSRTYHCASQFKRCNNGVETDLCVGYCKERKYRCQTVEDCTKGTTEIDCSSASSLTVSTLLVVCSAFLTSFLYL